MQRSAQGWAAARLGRCIPASRSWASPQVGTAPGIPASRHPGILARHRAWEALPPLPRGAKGAVYPRAALPWAKLFNPHVPAPASAASKIFVLASKGWPGAWCSFHAGWEASPNSFFFRSHRSKSSRFGCGFLFQPCSSVFCARSFSLAPSPCSVFPDFFGAGFPSGQSWRDQLQGVCVRLPFA